MSLERQPARAAVAIRAVRLDVPPSGFLGNTVGEVPHNGLLRPEFDADGDLDDVSVKYRRERADAVDAEHYGIDLAGMDI